MRWVERVAKLRITVRLQRVVSALDVCMQLLAQQPLLRLGVRNLRVALQIVVEIEALLVKSTDSSL